MRAEQDVVAAEAVQRVVADAADQVSSPPVPISGAAEHAAVRVTPSAMPVTVTETVAVLVRPSSSVTV